jgi:hypothetical protein
MSLPQVFHLLLVEIKDISEMITLQDGLTAVSGKRYNLMG